MCLGIPSRVVELEKNLLGMTIGKVEAGGTIRQVRMDYVPMAEIGDYVMVQMGFAVSVIDETEAGDVLDALDQLIDLSPLADDTRPEGSGMFSPPAGRGEGTAAAGGGRGAGPQGDVSRAFSPPAGRGEGTAAAGGGRGAGDPGAGL